MDFTVCIEGLTKVYRTGARALDNVHLQIGGGMFGLLGPNGAGKTTFMRILATLLQPTAGNVRIDGFDLRAEPGKVRSMLGYLPQHFNIYRRLSVKQALDYVALLKGLDDAGRRNKAVDEVLEQTHLTDKRSCRVGELSGGMKQRLGIGQALLGNPRLLIVDEPTAGLDPEERIRFRNLLAELSDDRVVILSTHIVGDVESSCSRLAVLARGRVRFAGAPADLAACARGSVWEVEADENSRALMPANARVVTTRRLPDALHMRVLCPERPLPQARLVEPGLEDGYLVAMQDAGVEPAVLHASAQSAGSAPIGGEPR